MKKPLLLGIIGLTIVVLTATTLFAQTVAGSSIIARMKAGAGDFTLTSELNAGEIGLRSAPITGKETGDILTAGEWNRMLELVAQGAGISNVELVTSQNVGTAAGTSYANRWSEANCPSGKQIISGGCTYPDTRNSFVHNAPKADLTGWNCGGIAYNGDISATSPEYPTRPTAYAICGEYGGGGSTGIGKFEINDTTTKTSYQLTWGGTSWVNNSLGATAIPCDGSGANQCYQVTTARHDHCVIISVGGVAPHVGLNYIGDKKYTVWNNMYANQSSGIMVQCYDNIGGGGSSGGGGVSSGGDTFTFLDTEITLISSGTTTASKGATTLDISTIAGVTIPPRAKAIQVYVQCNNYTADNQSTSLFLGKSTASQLSACQSNGMWSANDVDSNSLILPLAPDGKSIVYRYSVPNVDSGGQVVVTLRGFITE